MKTLILTYGTRGDVQPFVGLGRGLQARGDEVHIATSTRFEAFVTENGLGFCPVSDDLLGILDTRDGKDMLENTAMDREAFDEGVRTGRITSTEQLPTPLSTVVGCGRRAGRAGLAR